MRPFGVTLGSLWRPAATLGRTGGRQGTQKAGSGTHSVSNAVNSATVDSPGVALCDENIVNNMFFAKTTRSPICSKRVAQGGLKASFWSPFGHLGPSRSALWSTLGRPGAKKTQPCAPMHFQARKWSQTPLQNGSRRLGRRPSGGLVKHTIDLLGSVFVWGKQQSSKSTVLQPLKVTD